MDGEQLSYGIRPRLITHSAKVAMIAASRATATMSGAEITGRIAYQRLPLSADPLP